MQRSLQLAAGAAAALILLAIVMILAGQVFSRYVLSLSLSWPEEVSRYLFVWLVFVGGAAAVGSGQQLVVDSLTEFGPPGLQRAARIVSPIGALLGIGILLYTCIPLLVGPASRTASPASGIPLFWVYLAVPVGCAIAAMFLLHSLVRELRA